MTFKDRMNQIRNNVSARRDGKWEHLSESDFVSPTVSKTSKYIYNVLDWLHQGKHDDALWNFTSELLEKTAPGPVKRMIEKWSGQPSTGGTSKKEAVAYIVRTLDDNHGGKSDDALHTFIDLLLQRTAPASLVRFIDKMALEQGANPEEISELKSESGMRESVQTADTELSKLTSIVESMARKGHLKSFVQKIMSSNIAKNNDDKKRLGVVLEEVVSFVGKKHTSKKIASRRRG